MRNLNAIDWIATVLVIIGAINWGLVAFGFNLVNLIFGAWPTAELIIYLLVGLSGIWMIFLISKLMSPMDRSKY